MRSFRTCTITLLIGAFAFLVPACSGDDGEPEPGKDAAAAADDAKEDAGVEDTGGGGGCQTVIDCEKSGGAAGICRLWKCDDASKSCVKIAAPDGAICEDGSPCKPGTCGAGTCNAKQKECPSDGESCTIDKCDEATGSCINKKAEDGTTCDDGDKCTAPDTCKSGKCEGGANVCGCDPNKDPAVECPDDDNDECTGVFYCDASDKDPVNWACKLNKASIIKCKETGDACRINACDAKTKKCAITFADTKTKCDDGALCTSNDICDGKGKCVGEAANCCQTDKDCASKEDGDKCNGTLYCFKATGDCKPNPATVVYCQTVDDTPCLANTCQKKSGDCEMKPVNDGKECFDGNPCTQNTECSAGKCGYIANKSKNTCVCNADADCVAKDDDDLCNGVLYCNKLHIENGVLAPRCEPNPKTIVDCAQTNNKICHINVCQKATGKCEQTPEKVGASCKDGNPCTVNDACDKDAKCQAGKNTCECESDKDCSQFDDKNFCNGDLFCDKTLKDDKGNPAPYCRINPKSVVHCKSAGNTQCRQELCDPGTGKCGFDSDKFEGKACSDGKPCTVNDACKNGKCDPGPNLCECEPNNPKLACPKYNDGNPCFGTLYCDASKSIYKCRVNDSTVVKCPGVDDNYCRTNKCDKDTGKCGFVFHHVDDPCDDGDKCTTGEICKAGICSVPGLDPKQPCNDGNACTKDSCDKAKGCVYAATDGAACDDGDLCTIKDTCKDKACNPGAKKNCDDSNACTTNTCNPKSGCLSFNNSDLCDDGDKCTLKDFCVAGECTAGAPMKCVDTQLCTLDYCDKASGACKHDKVPASKVCDDGIGCTVEACNATTGCSYTVQDSKCDDGLDCTVDKCFAGKGCLHTPSNAACDKGAECTVYTCAVGKGCITKSAFDGVGCNDGKNCTFPDTCKAGKCAAGPKIPGCDVDPKQCQGKADGTACNTGDKCSTGACLGGVCRVNVESVHMRTLAGHGDGNLYDGHRRGAYFWNPRDVAVGPDGTVYVSDTGNHAIRRISPRGHTRLHAGPTHANYGYGYIDGRAIGARFNQPIGLDVDAEGGIWVSDRINHKVRYVPAGADGQRKVSTIAGSGKGMANGKGGAAKFYDPHGLALAPDGKSAYIADMYNHRVRLVKKDGTVTTFAGSGKAGSKDGKVAEAELYRPTALDVGPKGDVYVVGYYSDHARRIRRIDTKGIVTTLAGGKSGASDGKGSAATFYDMYGIAVDKAGVVWVTSTWNYAKSNRLATVMPDGAVKSVFSRTSSYSNGYWMQGPASKIQVYSLQGIDFTPTGDLVGASASRNRIALFELRRAKCDDGNPCTHDVCDAQTGKCGVRKESNCLEDEYPCHTPPCAKDTAVCTYKSRNDGSTCVDSLPCTPAQACHRGRCQPAGKVTTYAGYHLGSYGHGAWAWDAKGVKARFYHPTGLDLDAHGNIWVADEFNHLIRRINKAGDVQTIAGSY